MPFCACVSVCAQRIYVVYSIPIVSERGGWGEALTSPFAHTHTPTKPLAHTDRHAKIFYSHPEFMIKFESCVFSIFFFFQFSVLRDNTEAGGLQIFKPIFFSRVLGIVCVALRVCFRGANSNNNNTNSQKKNQNAKNFLRIKSAAMCVHHTMIPRRTTCLAGCVCMQYEWIWHDMYYARVLCIRNIFATLCLPVITKSISKYIFIYLIE